MKLILLLLSILSAGAEVPKEFVRAVHKVEVSGESGPIKGDYNPRTKTFEALGPLQIHYSNWLDSGVKGSYQQCADLTYSTRVMEGYFKRYCPKALKKKDFETMARTWNAGPKGDKNPKTLVYWTKVKKAIRYD
jgi:hypothetical protein